MLSSSLFCQAQNEAEKKELIPELTEAQVKAGKINETFSNLPKEQRIKYLTLRADAHRLFSKKRNFEALVSIYDMRSIFKDDPAVLNLLGAINVEFRDFGYARELFKHAINISGEDPKLLFNLAELAFCDNDWKACIKQMSYIRKKLDETDQKMKKLAILA